MTTKKVIEEQTDVKFSKERLLQAKKFKGDSDLLNALLKDDKTYSIVEVEELIQKYKKQEVK